MLDDLLNTLGLSILDYYNIYAIGNDGCDNGSCGYQLSLKCARPFKSYNPCPMKQCAGGDGHFKTNEAVP